MTGIHTVILALAAPTVVPRWISRKIMVVVGRQQPGIMIEVGMIMMALPSRVASVHRFTFAFPGAMMARW